MKIELIFIPSPQIGHLMATVEMAERIINQNNHLSITIIIISFNSKTTSTIASLTTTSNNRLRYKVISGGDQQPTELKATDSHVECLKPLVRDAVAKLLDPTQPDSPRLGGFVLDMYCTLMIDVANEFGVPSYLFYTSNAGFLGLLLHMQSMYDVAEGTYDMSELTELIVPTLSRPYPLKCLPYIFKSKEWFSFFASQARRFRETKGILVNTVDDLEPHALKFLSSGDSDNTPTVYSVGPLLHLGKQGGDSLEEKQSEILEWLDKQPAKSVVFLCFGSMGGFREEQAREIAVALEQSGHRFLWSLRRESPNIIKEPPGEFPNLEEILPQGFLDRTVERGKVIGWAPQVAVLANPSVGGFVSHGGWNSTLESMWFGVPMAIWPLYAEQKFNAFEMVEELGLAVEIKKYWRGDLLLRRTEMETVTAEEVERGIRCLMEQDSEVRKRVKELSQKCRMALTEGGPSQINLEKFIQDVMENIA